MDAAELYRTWIERVWNDDPGAAADLVTDDVVGHWPSEEVSGPEEFVAMVRTTLGMFERITFDIEVGPVVDGDLVAARWVGSGTTTTGDEARFVGHDLMRLRDGRVAEYWGLSVPR